MVLVHDRSDRAVKIIALLETATQKLAPPMSSLIVDQYGRDPFLILISCLLSLRARDVVTIEVSQDLFKHAHTPKQLLAIPLPQLEKIIYRSGFYKRKARVLHQVSQELIERFKGKVPNNESDLLSLSGVGRKTANLVLGQAFGVPAICVDTHVHKVCNRLGLVQTKTPDETEVELKKILPQDKWIEFNHLIVLWGQNVCVPISPFCSRCILAPGCPKNGVTKHR